MVNVSVDNEPVSIVLDGGQSTTVPTNETWRVSIYLGAANNKSKMSIDGVSSFAAFKSHESSNTHLTDVTLIGGQTITKEDISSDSIVFITGFVVSN